MHRIDRKGARVKKLTRVAFVMAAAAGLTFGFVRPAAADCKPSMRCGDGACLVILPNCESFVFPFAD